MDKKPKYIQVKGNLYKIADSDKPVYPFFYGSDLHNLLHESGRYPKDVQLDEEIEKVAEHAVETMIKKLKDLGVLTTSMNHKDVVNKRFNAITSGLMGAAD